MSTGRDIIEEEASAEAREEGVESIRPYTVSWVIEVDADSPREAAEKALEIQRSAESTATVFDVVDPTGAEWHIDLDEKEEETVTLKEVEEYLENEKENATGRKREILTLAWKLVRGDT